jgi:hypothetical protein
MDIIMNTVGVVWIVAVLVFAVFAMSVEVLS